MIRLSTLSTDATSKLDVLGHDGDSLGVDSAQVGVLEKSNKVSLRRLLQSKNGRALESELSLKVLRDLANKSLKGELANQELSALLIFSDFTQSHSSGSVSVRFLHTTCRIHQNSSLQQHHT